MEASREMLRRGTRRNRIAGRAEATRIAGYRVLIRSRGQQGVALRTRAPGPHNLAHKMRRESRQIRK